MITDAELQAYREKLAESYALVFDNKGLPLWLRSRDGYLSGFSAGTELGRLLGRIEALGELNISDFAKGKTKKCFELIVEAESQLEELLKENP